MQARAASQTSVLVCQGRAAAHERAAPGRFADPTAMALLRDDERVPVEQVRAGAAPKGWGARIPFEMVRACAEIMVPRTIAIDDAVRERHAPQLVILGAGLDGRAWRMGELADVDVFEVDHPASQQDKRDRLGDLAPLSRTLQYVAVDFTHDRLDAALDAAGQQPTTPTTWVWEGVVPYLGRADVDDTASVISARSAPGSRLVVNYQSPAMSAAGGRLVARAMTALAGRSSPWASEPRRSSWTPGAMRKLLSRHGLSIVRDDDLLTLAERLPVLVKQRRSLRTGRVAIADKA
jgi:methyltransferase (TIGR00027 family)